MSLSIYRNVLTLARVGVISWSVVLVLWALLVVWIYPSLEDTGVNFEDYLNAMPEQLRASMGIAGEAEAALMFNAGAFTYLGFLNVEYISWLPLLLGIYAVVYCGGLISKEVERGTLDVVLSQPVERTTFLLSKLAGFLTLALAATVASTRLPSSWARSPSARTPTCRTCSRSTPCRSCWSPPSPATRRWPRASPSTPGGRWPWRAS